LKDAVAYANCVGVEATKVKAVGFVLCITFTTSGIPLYLITLFAKGDRANLTQAERNDLRRLVDELVTISIRKLN
jgi:hypothetical protein